MKITFLGTASCFPTPARGVSCTALQLADGQIWLFDCGEGSQIQAQKSQIRMSKISKIFITHLHGDHLFGLPGLLCTLGSQMSEADRQTKVVDIYGPIGLRKFITTVLALARSPLAFKYNICELVPDKDQSPEHWDEWKVDHESLDIESSMEQSTTKISSEIDSDTGERFFVIYLQFKSEHSYDLNTGLKKSGFIWKPHFTCLVSKCQKSCDLVNCPNFRCHLNS